MKNGNNETEKNSAFYVVNIFGFNEEDRKCVRRIH